jgi:hypothetical protein
LSKKKGHVMTRFETTFVAAIAVVGLSLAGLWALQALYHLTSGAIQIEALATVLFLALAYVTVGPLVAPLFTRENR